MAGRKSDFTLTKLDDLFTTQAQRDEEQLSKIRDIPLDMMQLVESVKERGVITPATVRQKEDGRYELVSGHRRKRACELAGFETLRSEIVDLNRDEATILMVESNFQRSEILPSEKAFAYKMRLEAMKRQAGRPSKENASPVGIDLRGKQSLDLMSEECGDSRNQINATLKKTFGLWVYKPEGRENIRCLCPKCLNDYIQNPDYIVRRLDPFAKRKDRCDKCDRDGWDYVVTDRYSSKKEKRGSNDRK